MKPLLSTKTTRHPAVIDSLGGAPLPASVSTPKNVSSPKVPRRPKSPRLPNERAGISHRLRYAAALLLVVALIGWFLVRVFSGSDTPAPTLAVDDAAPTSIPALELAPQATAAEPVADANACRTDHGDQKSGAGVIAAFEYSYYVTRSGDAVRALATPDSPLPLADKITAGIDSVPIGTTHCVRITPITAGVYSVVIAEMRPGQAPDQFSQTITTKDIDGRWFVDSIS